MLPIIFGTGPRREPVDNGDFFCPHCQADRRYTRQHVRNYFRLYFIPVIPLGAGEYVIECQTCGKAFAPRILEQDAPTPKRKVRPLAVQLNSLEATLRGGFPVEYAVAELTAAGLDRDLANDNVRRVLGDARVQCPDCGLTYAAGVAACAEDGTPLTTA
jgi:DNA-directed RNA polymerase subunit RPC12/RpoP